MTGRSSDHRGLAFTRTFTEPGLDPRDLVAWERRAARIVNDKGEKIFEQGGVEVPQA